MVNKLIVLTVLLCTSFSLTQPLDTLIYRAVQNSPALRALQLQHTALQQKAEGMTYMPAPTLSVEFSQIPVGELNVVNKSISNSLAISQMFPLGGKLTAMSQAEQKGLPAIEQQYHAVVRKLSTQVRMEYYNLWGIEKRMLIQKDMIQSITQALQSLRARYASGGMLADISMTEGLLASANTVLENLHAERDAAILTLQSICGLAEKVQFTPIENPDNWGVLPLDDSLLILVAAHPDLQKMTAMEQMKIAESEANNKELIPDLMVQGMIMRMPQGMLLTTGQSMEMLTGMPKTEYMYSIMASVTLPFAPWSKGGIDKRTEALLTEAKQYHAERQEMQRGMQTALQKQLSTYKIQKEKAASLQQRTIPAYQRAESAAAASFAAATISLLQYYEYVKMRVMEEMNLSMALTDMYMSAAEIQMMTTPMHNTIEFDRNEYNGK